VDEIVLAVDSALNSRTTAGCIAADASGDGTITADELIKGINNLLNGCS
jgi:hypothetical protein